MPRRSAETATQLGRPSPAKRWTPGCAGSPTQGSSNSRWCGWWAWARPPRHRTVARRFPATIKVSVEKTFYIETFGCQMNAHDSEKVIGTLLQKGYSQVETPEQATYIFYNTCSIRDKAEQKVFNRLQQFKRDAGKGKVFAVLGCVAQQEGEKIFERAPHVSLVAGSASYTKLPEMLVQLEAGNRRVTGLNLDTTETFDTPFTRRDNPHSAYITSLD